MADYSDYANMVNGQPASVIADQWLSKMTVADAAKAIASIEEHIRNLEVDLRRCSWGITHIAQETADGISKCIDGYWQDVREIKSRFAQLYLIIPKSQQFTSNNITYYFVQNLNWEGRGCLVSLYVRDEFALAAAADTFTEAKSVLWSAYCREFRINPLTGVALW